MIVLMCERCMHRMRHLQFGFWKEHRDGYICPNCGAEAFVMPDRNMRHVSQRDYDVQVKARYGDEAWE